jgi:hypothetical protein
MRIMKRPFPFRVPVLTALAAAGLAFTLPLADFTTVDLPGTQPGIVQTFESPSLCQSCHQTGPGGHPVTITADWKGSPMAHSARDPIFYAAVAVANKYVNGVGEFCVRCHSPTGWLEGRGSPPTGQGLTGNDLNGVQCDFCHRAKDPLLPDSTVSPPVPGYGNGMFVVQTPRTPKRGPFVDALAMGHAVQGDSFYRRSDFCGVCHNVSNPLQAANATTQSPHEYGPIERTYSEWSLSWYAEQGEAGTCQSCHMPPAAGYGCILMASPLRPDVPRHDLTGGNAFLPDILADFWPGAVDTSLLAAGKTRAMETLRRAAAVDAYAYRLADTVRARIRVTNLTGHKLPTGYPEGRRMWLSVTGRNAGGDTLFQSGAYNQETGDLTIDAQAKVYESKPGLTAAAATQHGLTPGPSFHFVLNDTIYKDNRVPPRGFTNATFAAHHAQPVAHSYADGQYWDETSYILPSGVTDVVATLFYQTSSKEYITFLRDENIGNTADWRHWGDSLYAVWERRGKSRPVDMGSITVPVTDSIGTFAAPADQLPAGITLLQNYPNPFNPATTILFSIDRASFVRLEVFSITGRRVAELLRGRVDAGEHRLVFSGEGLPSGTYLLRLSAPHSTPVTRKVVLLR